VNPTPLQRGHEPDTTSVRGVSFFAGTLGASLVIVWVAVGLMLGAFGKTHDRLPPGVAPAPGEFASEGHWLHAGDYLLRIREEEDANLHATGRSDRAQPARRIPIEEAMDLLVRRGWPESPPDAGAHHHGPGEP
jgi:hypothetical protein